MRFAHLRVSLHLRISPLRFPFCRFPAYRDTVDLALQKHHLLQALLYALDVLYYLWIAWCHFIKISPYFLYSFLWLLSVNFFLRLVMVCVWYWLSAGSFYASQFLTDIIGMLGNFMTALAGCYFAVEAGGRLWSLWCSLWYNVLVIFSFRFIRRFILVYRIPRQKLWSLNRLFRFLRYNRSAHCWRNRRRLFASIIENILTYVLGVIVHLH